MMHCHYLLFGTPLKFVMEDGRVIKMSISLNARANTERRAGAPAEEQRISDETRYDLYLPPQCSNPAVRSAQSKIS